MKMLDLQKAWRFVAPRHAVHHSSNKHGRKYNPAKFDRGTSWWA